MSTFAPPITHDTIVAKLARLASPGCSYCLRCGMPWTRVEHHTTWYETRADGGPKRGCFPLCEGCWTLLGHPEARIEYYAAMVDGWNEHKPVEPETRAAIGRAVANEGASV